METEIPSWFQEATISKFVTTWNACSFRKEMGGAGCISFELLGCGRAVQLVWDSEGNVSVSQNASACSLSFTGTAAGWANFFEGRVTAAMALLRGDLHFTGRLAEILPYSQAFNRLPDAMRIATGG